MRRLLLIVVCLFSVAGVFAQDVKDTAKAATDTLRPFQKSPKLPAFNIRMMDSVTIFNTYNIPKGKKTLIVFFSPDCKHCQRQVKELTKGMDSISDIQLYMITPVHSMTELREFYAKYHLGDYENIKLVGRDYEFFFGGFYGTRVVPDMVLYDEQKKLIKLFEGNNTVTEIYNAAHGIVTPAAK